MQLFEEIHSLDHKEELHKMKCLIQTQQKLVQETLGSQFKQNMSRMHRTIENHLQKLNEKLEQNQEEIADLKMELNGTLVPDGKERK